jgi:hypothetical protein
MCVLHQHRHAHLFNTLGHFYFEHERYDEARAAYEVCRFFLLAEMAGDSNDGNIPASS